MFSLFASRLITLSIPRAAAVGTLTPLVTRRTFITGSRLAFPATAAKAATKKAPARPKAAPKKTTATKTVAKKKTAPAKKKVAKKPVAKKKTVTKPMKVILPIGFRPPRRGPGAFVLFVKKFMSGHPKAPDIATSQTLVQEGAKTWNLLNDAEKQPFRDEAKAGQEEKGRALADWYAAADPKLIKEYNRRRVTRKKPRLHKPKLLGSSGQPARAFARYVKTRIVAGTPARSQFRELSVAWNALSDAEREPYKAAFREEMAKYKAVSK